MLQLYFSPMACSLASRIALMEAGLEARYHLVHLRTKKRIEDDADFRGISAKGAVPVLVLENGERLTESAAVLQYIADLKPETGLAPRPGDPDRYRLQEWLSFIGAEIHKAFLFPTFWYKDDASKASARERIGQSVSVAAGHLANREYLVGNRFTVSAATFSLSAAFSASPGGFCRNFSSDSGNGDSFIPSSPLHAGQSR